MDDLAPNKFSREYLYFEAKCAWLLVTPTHAQTRNTNNGGVPGADPKIHFNSDLKRYFQIIFILLSH
jgi:hypothetical protein